MRNNPILYYFIVTVMIVFSVAFFRSEDFMPLLRNWQAKKYLEQSKDYQTIGKLTSARPQEEDAVKTAEKAYLLAPASMSVARNLAEVYYTVNPVRGLTQWETVVRMPGATLADRIHIVQLALEGAADSHALARKRKVEFDSGRSHFLNVARSQLELLSRDDRFRDRREFRMASAEYLAETGDPDTALAVIKKLRDEEKDTDPKIELLFCRIALGTNRSELLEEVVPLLQELAARGGNSAIEAIRHFSLVHLVRPLSRDEIKLLETYLEQNHPSVVDKLRLLSLELDVADTPTERSRIIEKSAAIFDLSMDSDLETYCNWLGKMGEMGRLVKELTLSRANRSEKLFQIRLAALANLGRFDDLVIELERASVLQDHWRYAFGARALSASRRFADAKVQLNKLIEAIYDDDRKVLAVCHWFVESGDEPSLCHILEKLSDDIPYETFCAEGLLRYRGATATLEDIQDWVTKLARSKPIDLKLQNNRLYWALLSPNPTKAQLDEWLEISRHHLARAPADLQFRVTNALALLRKDLPIEALSVLEDNLGTSARRTVWKHTRPAWTRIYAVALILNQRTEESIGLLNALSAKSSSRAEAIALPRIFPSMLQP